MNLCPRCNRRLLRTKVGQGVAFYRPQCRGRAVGASALAHLGGAVTGLGAWPL
jgi:Zn-finger nucleic acid-binding protein